MSKQSELDLKVKTYLLDGIDASGYLEDGESLPITLEDKTAFIKGVFEAEYGWAIGRLGFDNAVREWLQGLPSAINIAFYNHDILKLAVKWQSLPADYSEKQADKILDNYWHFMATKLSQLMRDTAMPKKLRNYGKEA